MDQRACCVSAEYALNTAGSIFMLSSVEYRDSCQGIYTFHGFAMCTRSQRCSKIIFVPREEGFAEDGTHLKKKCISGHKKCKIIHLTRSGILVDVRTHLGILRLLCTEITPYNGNPSHTERDFGECANTFGNSASSVH